MGTKMAVSFANIFMAKVETDILSQSVTKPLVYVFVSFSHPGTLTEKKKSSSLN